MPKKRGTAPLSKIGRRDENLTSNARPRRRRFWACRITVSIEGSWSPLGQVEPPFLAAVALLDTGEHVERPPGIEIERERDHLAAASHELRHAVGSPA